MTNLRKMFDYLREINTPYADEFGTFHHHWLSPYKSPEKRIEIVKQLHYYMGNDLADSQYYTVRKKKSCHFETCVHPDCYEFISRKRVNKLDSYVSFDDVLELADEVDVIRYNAIGPDAYLKEFNATQPDFLKISMNLLKAVVKYINDGRKLDANRT